jgi:pSer/pThr/pTyr-binding forkhead associated (FHA) protein
MIVGSPGSGQGLASLTVLEGPTGVVGEVYSLVKPVTVIGRNPARCDIVFYPNQDSSMSRVHCTIQQDGMYFLLTDNKSSNGTSVNGTAIKGNDPVQLRDGDEIVLGQLAKLGVKVRFNQRAEKALSDIADRTFIVDDLDKQGFDKYKDAQ